MNINERGYMFTVEFTQRGSRPHDTVTVTLWWQGHVGLISVASSHQQIIVPQQVQSFDGTKWMTFDDAVRDAKRHLTNMYIHQDEKE